MACKPKTKETERATRRRLLSSSVLYAMLFALALAVAVLSVARILDGGVILDGLAALVALLLGYQTMQTVRDLYAHPVCIDGPIGRHWSKTDFILVRSHYISLKRTIFSIPVEEWFDLDEGDSVAVTYFPHTNTVISVDRLTLARDEKERM